jgi:hypothetical protein
VFHPGARRASRRFVQLAQVTVPQALLPIDGARRSGIALAQTSAGTLSMLTLVRNRPAAELDRLRVAAAHLQAAVVHINNEAQRRISASPCGDPWQVEELRLIVRALCDVIDALDPTRRDQALSESNSSARSALPGAVSRDEDVPCVMKLQEL